MSDVIVVDSSNTVVVQDSQPKTIVTGMLGPKGVGVYQAAVNNSGNLIITLDNAVQVNAGQVVGPQGATGAIGPQGPQGVPGIIAFGDNSINSGNSVTSGTAQHLVDSFAITSFRTAKYLIQATYDNQVHCTEVLLIHNNSNTYFTEYGIVYSSASLFDLSTEISGNTVFLKATPIFGNTKIDFIRTALVSRSLGVPTIEDLEGDLSLLTGILDLMDSGDTVDLY